MYFNCYITMFVQFAENSEKKKPPLIVEAEFLTAFCFFNYSLRSETPRWFV
jgi:hypothetical protein